MCIMMVHYNYSNKMGGRPKRKNVKTQRGGMKPILTINLHEMYDNDRIVALFRDDREGRDMSEFFRKTQKIIQMPDGLEAKLYDNGQLCFNSKRVVRCPDWMMATFRLNGIPPPPIADFMKTILSFIQTNNNDYEMSEGRDNLLCRLNAKFSKSSKLDPYIDEFVVAFIKNYKTYVEITAPVVRASKQEQMARAEESSLSFLNDFDDMIHAIQSPFISERRKTELINLKEAALTAHRRSDTPGFRDAMIAFIQKLVVINYIMKHCRVEDQAEFEACRMEAGKKVIMPSDNSPNMLINTAKLYVNDLKDLMKQQQEPQQQEQQQQQQQQPQEPSTEWNTLTPNPEHDWASVASGKLGWGGRRIMQNHKKSIRTCNRRKRKGHKLTKHKQHNPLW